MNPKLPGAHASLEPFAVVSVQKFGQRGLHVRGVGDRVNGVSLLREGPRQPVGVSADTAFDGRVLADDEDLQKRAWGGINSMAAQVWSQKIPH